MKDDVKVMDLNITPKHLLTVLSVLSLLIAGGWNVVVAANSKLDRKEDKETAVIRNEEVLRRLDHIEIKQDKFNEKFDEMVKEMKRGDL